MAGCGAGRVGEVRGDEGGGKEKEGTNKKKKKQHKRKSYHIMITMSWEQKSMAMRPKVK